MNQSVQNFVALVGRIFLAAIFVISGVNKLTDFSGTAAFMSGAGLPAAEFLLVLTILIEIAGGLMIVLGLYTRQLALILFLFMIPVTAVFHNPWSAGDPVQMQQVARLLFSVVWAVADAPQRISIDQPMPASVPRHP